MDDLNPGHGFIQYPQNEPACQKHVLIIPGFLTEKATVNLGRHDISDISHLQNCDWFRHFLPPDPNLKANVHYYNWPSLNLEKALRKSASELVMMAPNLSSLLRPFSVQRPSLPLLARWAEAVKAADRTVKGLLQEINALEGEVFVIGHSLGGRIALRLLEHQHLVTCSKLFVCALAPAITSEELTVSLDSEHVKSEVFFSSNDKILKLLFRIGQTTLNAAMGYSGPSGHACIKGIDVSHSFLCEKMGHGDYEEHVLRLICLYSSMWEEFRFNSAVD